MLYTEAINRITNRYGKEFTWEHKAKIMGSKTSEMAQLVIDLLELPITAHDFEKEIVQIYEELFPTSELLPGKGFLFLTSFNQMLHLTQNVTF